MSNETKCQCATAPKLIFACSGAADVGEISDRAARRLTKEGKGKMYCLAGVGGRVPDILVNVQAAQKYSLVANSVKSEIVMEPEIVIEA